MWRSSPGSKTVRDGLFGIQTLENVYRSHEKVIAIQIFRYAAYIEFVQVGSLIARASESQTINKMSQNEKLSSNSVHCERAF